jgi:hypothetical protein
MLNKNMGQKSREAEGLDILKPASMQNRAFFVVVNSRVIPDYILSLNDILLID